ncbi:MAG: NYN domain-containing protein [Corynebacterium sp.]|nr:NYN domain-containing protein [Corynebacterium sp.]
MRDTLLLVWDAPNMDMTLSSIIGARPSGAQRPRFQALGRWLLAEAGRLSHTSEQSVHARATLFCNVPPQHAEQMRPWVDAVRSNGFAVFAKPKTSDDSDVDPEMSALIAELAATDSLAGVIVASADGRNFKTQLQELAASGVATTVLSFREQANWAIQDPEITFVDCEAIPNLFQEPLPRVDLAHLPAEGAWLEPLQPLESLLRR